MIITKVLLSDAELTIAHNLQFILTKRTVIDKAGLLFNHHIPFINTCFTNILQAHPAVLTTAPKISKGESYNLLPYVLLDYPACFGKQDIFAVRTMFWWGNFISITLLIKGVYKSIYEHTIIPHLCKKENKEVYVCVADNPWQHHFEPSNYRLANLLQPEEIADIYQKDFLKIALKYELHHWNMMQQILPVGYQQIVKLLSP